MTYLDADGQVRERLDWAMLRYGPVGLFRKPPVLAERIAWSKPNGYQVAQTDCENCGSEQELLWAIGQSLGFHRWPYPNLDGFNDDCRQLELSSDGGFAVVLHRFDAVWVKFPDFARHVLDILAWASWDNPSRPANRILMAVVFSAPGSTLPPGDMTMPRTRRPDPDKERFWRDRLLRWQRSALSVRAFCQQHQLRESAFYFWKRTLQQRDQAAPPVPANDPALGPPPTTPRPAFVPVHVAEVPPPTVSTTAALELVLRNGRLLRFGAAVEPHLLRVLLPLLEELP